MRVVLRVDVAVALDEGVREGLCTLGVTVDDGVMEDVTEGRGVALGVVENDAVCSGTSSTRALHASAMYKLLALSSVKPAGEMPTVVAGMPSFGTSSAQAPLPATVEMRPVSAATLRTR